MEEHVLPTLPLPLFPPPPLFRCNSKPHNYHLYFFWGSSILVWESRFSSAKRNVQIETVVTPCYPWNILRFLPPKAAGRRQVKVAFDSPPPLENESEQADGCSGSLTMGGTCPGVTWSLWWWEFSRHWQTWGLGGYRKGLQQLSGCMHAWRRFSLHT